MIVQQAEHLTVAEWLNSDFYMLQKNRVLLTVLYLRLARALSVCILPPSTSKRLLDHLRTWICDVKVVVHACESGPLS